MEPAVEFRHASFFSGEYIILDNISLRIPKNQFTVIMGTSGSGKSTLLKAAAGIIAPDKGTLLVDDSDIAMLPENKLYELRKKGGFVFQDAALWANKNLWDNLELPLRVAKPGISINEIAEKIQSHIERFQFRDELSLRPANLSSGEKKIISIIRGIITEPQRLYLDEPLASLDRASVDRLLNLLSEYRKSGRTIIAVTHNEKLTSSLADYLIVLKEGSVLTSGSFNEVKETKDPEVIEVISEVLGETATYDQDILHLLDDSI
ncbi:MAG: ATP-binding cassette domain-containing protein [Spirochaetia bacterium]